MDAGQPGSKPAATTLLLQLMALPAAEQGPFLDSIGLSDPALRQRIQALRDDLDEIDDRLDTSGLQRMAGVDRPPEDLVAKDLFDDFEILGIVGEGGMGVVYHAKQLRPVEREVAIKVLRAHSGDQLISRFHMEWKTLARMEHPTIARLLEAREDRQGNPCFVMELIRGEALLKYCEQESVDMRGRVEILRRVCLGVQHAHDKGILHRDLKPDNILVVKVDGGHEPKVIDFGIARALEASSGSMRTATGQLLGTPEYMSPEQALGLFGQLDARSDIYSLGVVLYRLLTGNFPYDFDGASLLDVIRTVAEEPPLRPTRFSTSDRRIDRDIELVVLKALEKDPGRRYRTAEAFARDLQRYLDGEPVRARPISTLYQFRKMVARNRIPSILISSLFLLTVVSTVVVWNLYQNQRREKEFALLESASRERVNVFLAEVMTGAAGDRPIDELTVAEALLSAEETILETPIEDPAVQARVLLAVGNVHQSLGENDVTLELRIQAALAALSAIDDEFPNRRAETRAVRVFLDDPYSSDIDAPAVCAPLLDRVDEDMRRVLSLFAGAIGGAAQVALLADQTQIAARFNRERKAYQEAFEPDLVPQVSGYLELFLLRDLGRIAEAEAATRAYLNQFPDPESQAHYGMALATILLAQERSEEAVAAARAGVEGIGDNRGMNFALTRSVLAQALLRSGHVGESKKWIEEAEQASRSRLKNDQRLEAIHALRSELALVESDFEMADDLASQALTQVTEAGGSSPSTLIRRGLWPKGTVLNITGEFEEAETIYRTAIGIEPEDWRGGHVAQSRSRFGLAWALVGQGKHAEAAPYLEEVLAAWSESYQSPPFWWLDFAQLLRYTCLAAETSGAETPCEDFGQAARTSYERVLEHGRPPYTAAADPLWHRFEELCASSEQ